MGEQSLLHPGDEHHGELQTLRVMEGHQGHKGLVLLEAVDVGVETYLLQEVG
jgi:hypothetical protein